MGYQVFYILLARQSKFLILGAYAVCDIKNTPPTPSYTYLLTISLFNS